jgi:acetyl-CoA C-acetyltransferase
VSLRGAAFIAGAYEHPRRDIPDRTVAQVHAEVADGALRDAGLTFADVDAYYCAGDAPGFGALSMAEYLGLRARTFDSSETGGSSYLVHVGHAAAMIAAGHASVALVTLAGLPRNGGAQPGGAGRIATAPESEFENLWGSNVPGNYALAARRHMHEFGTTSEQLAEIKVAASLHAQHNPNAFLRDVVTVEEVIGSPVVADPLHRLDCCVITDGGGALVVVHPDLARDLRKPPVRLLGSAEAIAHTSAGRRDFLVSAAAQSGPRAFGEAGLSPRDVQMAMIYDSFTITVLVTLEDLGFCKKGQGGAFVSDGRIALGGELPINTDGGGLSSNHPGMRGIFLVVEAVKQLRGECGERQVKDCRVALAHGTGGALGNRHSGATLILGRS